eukprot:5167281-Prymnesium_polylepis.2
MGARRHAAARSAVARAPTSRAARGCCGSRRKFSVGVVGGEELLYKLQLRTSVQLCRAEDLDEYA